MTLNRFVYRHDTSDWELGPYEGITVCTGDRLTKTLHVANPKTGKVFAMSCVDQE